MYPGYQPFICLFQLAVFRLTGYNSLNLMSTLLLVLQIILGVALSGLILVQSKGTGLGRAFGQATYHSKRGMEHLVFRLTIVLAVTFILVSVLAPVIS